ncbi:MAG TPA: hypothetical protein VHR66_30445, partial [Gemmataceae bacterium]|nr:hypothetical protein [Gemmataceae bacterium]
VVLLDPAGFLYPGNRHVFIVYASDKPLDLADVKAVAQESYERQGLDRAPFIHVLDPTRFEDFLNRSPELVLTDQFAPVDNLMSGVFKERSKEKR